MTATRKTTKGDVVWIIGIAFVAALIGGWVWVGNATPPVGTKTEQCADAYTKAGGASVVGDRDRYIRICVSTWPTP